MRDEILYFRTPADMRAWLRDNHDRAAELHVGYFKKHTAQPSITWPESVAEALCYGWIDGVRRTVDEERYTIRFTPRRPGSTWSAVNIRMVAELEASGRMTDAGRAAFARRVDGRSRYSYERDDARLDAARLKEFRRRRDAWAFFEAQPPGYRKKAVSWVMSAKRDDARDRRFARLLEASIAGKRLA